MQALLKEMYSVLKQRNKEFLTLKFGLMVDVTHSLFGTLPADRGLRIPISPPVDAASLSLMCKSGVS